MARELHATMVSLKAFRAAELCDRKKHGRTIWRSVFRYRCLCSTYIGRDENNLVVEGLISVGDDK